MGKGSLIFNFDAKKLIVHSKMKYLYQKYKIVNSRTLFSLKFM